jgi:hypothetical protein
MKTSNTKQASKQSVNCNDNETVAKSFKDNKNENREILDKLGNTIGGLNCATSRGKWKGA